MFCRKFAQAVYRVLEVRPLQENTEQGREGGLSVDGDSQELRRCRPVSWPASQVCPGGLALRKGRHVDDPRCVFYLGVQKAWPRPCRRGRELRMIYQHQMSSAIKGDGDGDNRGLYRIVRVQMRYCTRQRARVSEKPQLLRGRDKHYIFKAGHGAVFATRPNSEGNERQSGMGRLHLGRPSG